MAPHARSRRIAASTHPPHQRHQLGDDRDTRGNVVDTHRCGRLWNLNATANGRQVLGRFLSGPERGQIARPWRHGVNSLCAGLRRFAATQPGRLLQGRSCRVAPRGFIVSTEKIIPLPLLTLPRFQMPNSLHYVLTLDHCAAVGHHYCPISSMPSSVDGIIHCLIRRATITNDMMFTTRVILRRMLTACVNWYMSNDWDGGAYET